MKVVAIIQARMGSSRLPGKVLRPLVGKPVLWHIIHRLRKCRTVDQIAIATSTQADDDAIAKFAEAEKIHCTRGSEDNVLERYALAAKETNADIIIRVTGDAPLVDPVMIDIMVETLIREHADYCTGVPGVPVIHEGFCPMTHEALQRLSDKAGDDPVAREHVTAYFKEHPDFVRITYVDMDSAYRFEGVRLSADTPADLAFLETVYDRLKAPAGEADVKDVVKLLRAEPELLEINAHVRQKHPDEKSRRVIIRCDGDASIGIGHIKRCLALAGQLRDVHGCGVTFAMASGPEGFDLVRGARYPIAEKTGSSEDAWLDALIKQTKPDALILDVRSDLDPELVRRWKAQGVLIATIDDPSDRRLVADIAFYPPVPQVNEMDWNGFKGRLYVGWEWVALGQAIPASRTRAHSDRPMILITMGGSDPAGLTLNAIRALDTLEGEFDASVVLGPGFAHYRELEDLLSKTNRDFRVLRNIENMADVMAQADLAVASFGVTAYELAAAGVPALYLCLTDDHARSAEPFVKAGTAISIGVYSAVTISDIAEAVERLLGDPDVRRAMAEKGRQLLNGKGAAAIAGAIVKEAQRSHATA